jgi:hypothetical protein
MYRRRAGNAIRFPLDARRRQGISEPSDKPCVEPKGEPPPGCGGGRARRLVPDHRRRCGRASGLVCTAGPADARAARSRAGFRSWRAHPIPDPIRSIRAFHARRACQIFPINPLPEPHQSSPHRQSRRRSNPWARSRPLSSRRRSLRPLRRPSRHRRPTIQATTPARVRRRPTIVERSYAAAAVRPYALRHRFSDASFRAMLPSLPPAHAVTAFRGLDEPRLDQRQRHVAPSVGPAEQLGNLRPVLAPAHATAAGSGFRCSRQVAIIRPLVQWRNASEKYRGIVLRT